MGQAITDLTMFQGSLRLIVLDELSVFMNSTCKKIIQNSILEQLMDKANAHAQSLWLNWESKKGNLE